MIRTVATAKEVQVATLRLAGVFRDAESMRYDRVVNAVTRGKLPARVSIAAPECARRPGGIKPPAAFTGQMERCRSVVEVRWRWAMG